MRLRAREDARYCVCLRRTGHMGQRNCVFQRERDAENYAPLAHCARNTSRDLSDSTMPDETSEPKPTEKKRPVIVHDLKAKTDPKGGAGNGGKSDKTLPRTEEVDFNL